ncbi:adenosylmethionine decarboxylase [Pikeienuella piscinae]|uniref:S-adenosylmethionine decarboxylase proenzyme n=1 Tax=Pikeienuella piscinae TaxID=2748098 RepID=A0A7L5BVB7_9RHOB|nr:adenosylmethionine decarboxylase [Pikeienuella piscinae]QIE54427.1 adenosylmethionine decarboxylase [Pikeienuella piscinae]
MNSAHLFRLGTDLEYGATHEETDRHGDEAVSCYTLPLDDGYKLAADNDLFDAEREDHFMRRDGKVFAGTHLILEVVEGEGLDDQERIEAALRDCVTACGATLLHIHTHKFTPQGVSGVAVLAESHISVHTWPEIGYGAFDVFMCGDAEPRHAIGVLRRAFSAREVRVKELLRGEGIVEAAL